MLATRVLKLRDNIKQAAIQSGRSLDDITVIAVTKYTDAKTSAEVLPFGLNHFGENRVDELIEKQKELQDETITWHLIGTLQRRKVKEIINQIDYFHALDSLKLASEIEKRAEKVINCFVQINIAKEAQKHGIMSEEAFEFMDKLSGFSKIRVVGLMTMAPIDANETQLRDIFSSLRILQEQIREKNLKHAPCTELSMGMSRDFQIAVEEGATFIRIGSTLFTEESNGNIR
ncbi:MAG: YggS family pyridoxal phosphate-dependent enzyme [Streptococcaceae bacterium]|jgi:pyridoxal phosphate enzyme (YggS family)|nr:YggS family pyridoxal phosphate-dependent enzyme [Streptococcaceae bacterium]